MEGLLVSLVIITMDAEPALNPGELLDINSLFATPLSKSSGSGYLIITVGSALQGSMYACVDV